MINFIYFMLTQPNEISNALVTNFPYSLSHTVINYSGILVSFYIINNNKYSIISIFL